jgi:Tol biopolymer transport system component
MWSTPTFAPKTGMIVFGRARSPYASQTSNYQLYLMDRDGSDRQLIFPADEEIGLKYPEVAWSPEGDRIVTVYQENLFLIAIPDGDVHQLTVGGGVTAVQWQSTGWKDDDQIGEPPEGEETVDPEDRDGDSEVHPTPD